MRATLALRHEDRTAVLSALDEKNETAWFAVCAPGRSTVVCHRLHAVPESMYSERRPDRLMICSPAWVPLARDAAKRGLGLLFAHTHPRHRAAFSPADDDTERTLRSDLNNMAPGVELTSAVFAGGANGRIEFAARSGRRPDADTWPITRLRFAGRELHLCDDRPGNGAVPAAFFDRQIRAFGADGQAALHRIRAGVVGLGGTGSATAQQLLRLGVGHLCVVDDDIVTDTSLTRGWGSRRDDIGQPKTAVIQRLACEIGLGTTVEAVNGRCTEAGILERLSALDVIFGCTDDHAGRIHLNRLAYGQKHRADRLRGADHRRRHRARRPPENRSQGHLGCSGVGLSALPRQNRPSHSRRRIAERRRTPTAPTRALRTRPRRTPARGDRLHDDDFRDGRERTAEPDVRPR